MFKLEFGSFFDVVGLQIIDDPSSSFCNGGGIFIPRLMHV
jgi:hypothetical protein